MSVCVVAGADQVYVVVQEGKESLGKKKNKKAGGKKGDARAVACLPAVFMLFRSS
jgi:hypothetical protein